MIRVLLLALLLAGCTETPRDPLAVYGVDAKAFELPVLLVVPF